MEPSTSESNDQARRKHPQTVNHTVAARLQALTLAEHGVPKAIAGAKSGMSEQSVTRLMKKARLRGYNPEVSTIMKEEYVTDGARPGRRLKVTPEKESAILASGKLSPLPLLLSMAGGFLLIQTEQYERMQTGERNHRQYWPMNTACLQQPFFGF